jgi:hypothetical protein
MEISNEKYRNQVTKIDTVDIEKKEKRELYSETVLRVWSLLA